MRIGEAGRARAIIRRADLYLLLEQEQCVTFELSWAIERIVWHGAKVTRIRILDPSPVSYDERIVCDERGFVQRIERCYGPRHERSGGPRRAFITDRPSLAERWAGASTPREGWTSIRRALGSRCVRNGRIDRIRVPGHSVTLRSPEDETRLLDVLVSTWSTPGRVIEGIEEITPGSGVWMLSRDRFRGRGGHATNCEAPGLIGPVWIGCRPIRPERECIVGPAWLPDDADAFRAAEVVERRKPATVRSISEIELAEDPPDARRRTRPLRRRPAGLYPSAKRALDVVVSGAALLVAAPLLLLIALAIMATDGRPILFRHKRQSLGGRDFDCLKFRTMHRDADKLIPGEMLKTMNVCDGAQVYIPDDPRVTRVGRLLRRAHLDELPQLWNVLVGDMSLVGPRPSPDRENRYCPAWRELRLSVRPGITGLWQLRRTRAPGRDFQEWIRYDIEYVRSASFLLDLRILIETARLMIVGRNDPREKTHETK